MTNNNNNNIIIQTDEEKTQYAKGALCVVIEICEEYLTCRDLLNLLFKVIRHPRAGEKFFEITGMDAETAYIAIRDSENTAQPLGRLEYGKELSSYHLDINMFHYRIIARDAVVLGLEKDYRCIMSENIGGSIGWTFALDLYTSSPHFRDLGIDYYISSIPSRVMSSKLLAKFLINAEYYDEESKKRILYAFQADLSRRLNEEDDSSYAENLIALTLHQAYRNNAVTDAIMLACGDLAEFLALRGKTKLDKVAENMTQSHVMPWQYTMLDLERDYDLLQVDVKVPEAYANSSYYKFFQCAACEVASVTFHMKKNGLTTHKNFDKLNAIMSDCFGNYKSIIAEYSFLEMRSSCK